jgi:hypothetical protein
MIANIETKVPTVMAVKKRLYIFLYWSVGIANNLVNQLPFPAISSDYFFE